jgi:hypothetical protein
VKNIGRLGDAMELTPPESESTTVTLHRTAGMSQLEIIYSCIAKNNEASVVWEITPLRPWRWNRMQTV